jgi:hypothetical protein
MEAHPFKSTVQSLTVDSTIGWCCVASTLTGLSLQIVIPLGVRFGTVRDAHTPHQPRHVQPTNLRALTTQLLYHAVRTRGHPTI